MERRVHGVQIVRDFGLDIVFEVAVILPGILLEPRRRAGGFRVGRDDLQAVAFEVVGIEIPGLRAKPLSAEPETVVPM